MKKKAALKFPSGLMTREALEIRENEELASYAQKSSLTKGRLFKEDEPKFRTVYQRDRDRIIHSSAFRRLEYKTQVFVNHEGDYYRTRLTHSLEASQVARSAAKALRLNTDLVETISLAHDLGHTPFGHAGEDELRELMKAHGGFDHNLQSLRVVDHLEHQYPNFRGLNLTYESRVGLFKHPDLAQKAMDAGMGKFELFKNPSLESQVVDISDEIAYDNHDLDDGLTSGLLHEKDLENLKLWRRASDDSHADTIKDAEIRKYQIIRRLVNLEVTDLIRQSKINIDQKKIDSPAKAMQATTFTIGFSAKMREERVELRHFLKERLYKHYRVVRMTDKARRFLRELFKAYLKRPQQLPPGSQKRLKTEGEYRVICDYIAGMTDRYAQDEYKKLFQPFEKV